MNLRSPALSDEVELIDGGDSVDIKYRLRGHRSKYRLFVLALVLIFPAITIFAVIFTRTKKSSSEDI